MDSGTKKVYQYKSAAGLTSGSLYATANCNLAANTFNPQDIADLPVGDMLSAPAPAPFAANVPASVALAPASGRASALAGIPSLSGQGALWAAVGSGTATGAIATSVQLPSNGILPAATERAAPASNVSGGAQTSDPRTAAVPVVLTGAGSDTAATNLFIDALTGEESQAAAAATDSFFALLANQPLSAE